MTLAAQLTDPTNLDAVRQALGSLDPESRLAPLAMPHLTALGVAHQFTVLPGLDHSPSAVLSALGQANWDFYNAALATPCRTAADLDCSGIVNAADLSTLLGAWGAGAGPAGDSAERLGDLPVAAGVVGVSRPGRP